MSEPFIKFFKSNWLSDTRLRMCSGEARALWIDLLCIMHDAEERGFLALGGVPFTAAQIARVLSMHHRKVDKLLMELGSNGVYSRDERGVIYSRRMVRDHAKALQDQENGRKGGNPRIVQGVNPPPNPPVNGRDNLRVQSPEARDFPFQGKSSDSDIDRPRGGLQGSAPPPPGLDEEERALIREKVVDLFPPDRAKRVLDGLARAKHPEQYFKKCEDDLVRAAKAKHDSHSPKTKGPELDPETLRGIAKIEYEDRLRAEMRAAAAGGAS